MKTRRGFLRGAAMIGAGLLMNTGCGDDDPPTPDATPPPGSGDGGSTPDASLPSPDASPPAACPRVTARIMTNHGHLLMIPAEDLRAGIEVTYDIQGMGTHSHSVTLTTEHFATLNRVEELMLESTSADMHTHMMSVRCAPMA